jgi:hypothetical protein
MELSLICRVSRLAELPAVKLILASMPEPVNPVKSAAMEISSMVPSELIVSKKMDEFERMVSVIMLVAVRVDGG